MLTLSQVSPGRKNHLSFELSGSKASLNWDSENPEELWIRLRDEPNQFVLRGAAGTTKLEGGSGEIHPDTLKDSLTHSRQCTGQFTTLSRPVDPQPHPTTRRSTMALNRPWLQTPSRRVLLSANGFPSYVRSPPSARIPAPIACSYTHVSGQRETRCTAGLPKCLAIAWPSQEHQPHPKPTAKTPSFLALLTDPWVLVSAWQCWAVSAEGEHGQGDECFGGAESERNPGQESDFGVGGFDQSLG